MSYKTQVALGAMELIASGSITHELQALGISRDDYMLTTGPMPWKAPDQARVKATLNTFVYGAMDIAGLPHFDVSAEYCAAMIYIMVNPRNHMKACHIMGRLKSSDDLTGVPNVDEVQPKMVFALLCEIAAKDVDKNYDEFKHRFEKSVGFKIKKAEMEIVGNA